MLPVIQAENISKAYQIGEFSTGTLSQDIERWWGRMRGKEDRYLKIGETNDRTVKGDSNIVWSLKDLNFSINQGDAVGIIGRNGAGKSTLLKILSRVTTPTLGSIKIKGRVASLLEVGTGFHPELNGRENIFLNGAILGMKKNEIKSKFDEIVDFSGVERYIDTPVKRYSSGMYVRLAFAVAAHLDSEILIIDEVLAVGDAEFQNKCLGKMGEVSKGQGRTVLFVSHNIGAIKRLCNKGIYLEYGQKRFDGNITQAISMYSSFYYSPKEENKTGFISMQPGQVGKQECYLDFIEILQEGKRHVVLDSSKNTTIRIGYTITKAVRDFSLAINLTNTEDEIILHTADIFASTQGVINPRNPGSFVSECVVPAHYLNDGKYGLTVGADIPNEQEFFYVKSILNFTIESTSELKEKYASHQWKGVLNPESVLWSLAKA